MDLHPNPVVNDLIHFPQELHILCQLRVGAGSDQGRQKVDNLGHRASDQLKFSNRPQLCSRFGKGIEIN